MVPRLPVLCNVGVRIAFLFRESQSRAKILFRLPSSL